MNPATVTALALISGLLAGGSNNGLAELAEPCTSTQDCEPDLECVILDDDDSVCLPRPADRQERRCDADSDCTLSDGELWPLEAECLDGACRCLGADINCGTEEDGAELLLEEETCRCVPVGGEGDACITSHTCEISFACSSGECRNADGADGSACRADNDCESGICAEVRDEATGTGICR